VPLNDADLIDEILDGSQAAFDVLIQRHQHLVYRIAYSYVRDAEAALDISQNVFIKVHHKLTTFHGRSSFLTWLSRIAQNESLTWVRSQQRHTGHTQIQEISGPAVAAPQEQTLIRSEQSKDLLALVHRLNPRQRQAVLLRYFENMPIRDIGDVLLCSEGHVKNILFRSLQKLRQHLSGQDGWDQELGS